MAGRVFSYGGQGRPRSTLFNNTVGTSPARQFQRTDPMPSVISVRGISLFSWLSVREGFSEIGERTQTYSYVVDGNTALIRNNTVTQEEISVGDKVALFALLDGKTLIVKVEPDSDTAYTVGRLTSSHIYFDDEITIQEA